MSKVYVYAESEKGVCLLAYSHCTLLRFSDVLAAGTSRKAQQ